MARNRKAKKLLKENRRKRRNTIIIGVVLVVLMIVSIAGFGGNHSSNASNTDFKYNNFDIKAVYQSNGGIIFVAQKDGQELGFFYNQPVDVEDVNVSDNFRQDIISKNNFVISSKPIPLDGYAGNNEIYINLIIRHLETIGRKTVTKAVTENTLFTELPAINCSDATPETPVIIINDDTTSAEIVDENISNCYEIRANDLDLLKVRDRILYIVLGIQ